jgi:hypothetical protein
MADTELPGGVLRPGPPVGDTEGFGLRSIP